MKKTLITGILIGLFITLGTVAAVLYATGYRFEIDGQRGNFRFIEGTGILVATSRPDGARVLVNDDLTTATNNTINLAPGGYDVRIEKDGYLTWSKRIIIRKSLVSEANAFLLPTAPKLEAVTTIGVSNVAMDRSGTLLAYGVSSASASRNGVYVLNMSSGPFVFLGASGIQVVDEAIDKFSEAKFTFSPDGKEILAELQNPIRYYLFSTDGRNQIPRNVSQTLPLTRQDWEQQQMTADKKIMDSLSLELQPIARDFFDGIKLSDEQDKILYTASLSATLAPILKKAVPSLNSTPDQRKIAKGNIYVYDIEEDKNYLIYDASKLKEGQEPPNYLWHADSRHLIFSQNGKINIVEYEGGNLTTVYDGHFLDDLIFPWPNGGSIGIVSRLSETVPYNIYRISLQ